MMNDTTRRNIELGLAYCGPAFILGYIIFWAIMGHNIPPPNMMGMTAEQLVSEYYGKYPEIRVGMIVSAVVGLIYLPWSCLLASMLKDKQGNYTALSFMELTGGTLTAFVLALCPAIWAACAFMVGEVDAGVIKMVHMFTWFIYDCTCMITTIQLTGLGLYVIFNRDQQIFPAWTGWSAIGTGLVFVPLSLLPFVSEGPFKLPGLWNFFVVYTTWLFAFFGVFSFYILKHLHGTNTRDARGTPALV